jgi:hypothetical protein
MFVLPFVSGDGEPESQPILGSSCHILVAVLFVWYLPLREGFLLAF